MITINQTLETIFDLKQIKENIRINQSIENKHQFVEKYQNILNKGLFFHNFINIIDDSFLEIEYNLNEDNKDIPIYFYIKNSTKTDCIGINIIFIGITDVIASQYFSTDSEKITEKNQFVDNNAISIFITNKDTLFSKRLELLLNKAFSTNLQNLTNTIIVPFLIGSPTEEYLKNNSYQSAIKSSELFVGEKDIDEGNYKKVIASFVIYGLIKKAEDINIIFSFDGNTEKVNAYDVKIKSLEAGGLVQVERNFLNNFSANVVFSAVREMYVGAKSTSQIGTINWQTKSHLTDGNFFINNVHDYLDNITIKGKKLTSAEKSSVPSKVSLRLASSVGNQTFGYDNFISIRIIPMDDVTNTIDIRHMGLTPNQVSSIFQLSNGNLSLAVVGKTGSGKSTLLAAITKMYLEFHNYRKAVTTVENPIETLQKGVFQRQVDVSNINDVSKIEKALLRQNPDLVVLAEIRDSPMGNLYAKNVTTGKRVFFTMHTGSICEIPNRLYALLSDSQKKTLSTSNVISSSDALIVQALLPRLCNQCKTLMDDSYFEKLKKENKEKHDIIQSIIKERIPLLFFNEFIKKFVFAPDPIKSKHCSQCDGNGTKGLVVCTEILNTQSNNFKFLWNDIKYNSKFIGTEDPVVQKLKFLRYDLNSHVTHTYHGIYSMLRGKISLISLLNALGETYEDFSRFSKGNITLQLAHELLGENIITNFDGTKTILEKSVMSKEDYFKITKGIPVECTNF